MKDIKRQRKEAFGELGVASAPSTGFRLGMERSIFWFSSRVDTVLSSTEQLSAQGARCKVKTCKWKVKISQFVPSLKKCKVQGARCKVQRCKGARSKSAR